MKTLCNKLTQRGVMSEPRPCIRELKHKGGYHTPDLIGMIFGNLTITSQAPPYHRPKNTGSSYTRWYATDHFGTKRIVLTSQLLGGVSRGKDAPKGKGTKSAPKTSRPEYNTVKSHWQMIYTRTSHPTYKGMPFCDDWNPNKGGSFKAGMYWIIENLGPKPSKKHSMDIIDHSKGFVPGNLRWTIQQSSNKLHRTMFLLTVEQHTEALRQLGYGVHKLEN